jgi:hypothetical protein
VPFSIFSKYVTQNVLPMARFVINQYPAMPENIQANNGKGSSYIYDKFLSKQCQCCAETMKKHCATDILVGMWYFLIMTAALLP